MQEDIELALIKRLVDFNDVVRLCGHTYLTNHLAKYLFELAKGANQYYEKVRVLQDEDEERQKARVALISEIVKTLEKGLNLLGVQVPERI